MKTATHWPVLVAVARRGCALIALVFALSLSRVEAASGASSSGNPTITASPQVVPFSGSRRDGLTTLIWEGGAGHQNAEVWVQVDGQGETLVAKQGKGGRRVPVEPGKTYLYILKDAGERLASVSVRGAASSDPAAPSNAQSSKAPSLRASPQLVQISGAQRQGSTNLLWDAGPEHRNAELRVQVDGQEETLVAKQAKGGTRLKVDAGKTYLYILTDAGERLATVTVKTAGPTPSAPPSQASSSKSPVIYANPQVVPIPGAQRSGFTTLIWEAGADHRNAEVWVQVDGQAETLVAKQAKGGRQVPVEPGRTYLYTLTDAGQRLGAVTVKSIQLPGAFPNK